jgi:hypothetical protein
MTTATASTEAASAHAADGVMPDAKQQRLDKAAGIDVG